ncbi:isochorismatase family protein [Agarivorans sp. TSD2052]|uniref:isochorismatase family protein n=1 Tax=Agarivorans sp. TSD2052 TaxID=2937286 RepID=UPI00200FD875|nr:isochorismatase family protein [Agarivorans sp. TSD2052]UPW17474.1 isochorismatase family protein [Agarivorans sp. TSD2052]
MQALLIIDMQNACFEGAKRFAADQVIKHINQLAWSFRQKQLPVIHIQHQDAADFLPNSHGWQFIPQICLEHTDLVIAKTCCDAFINTDLSLQLAKLKVEHIAICGCATDFCVDSTIKGSIAQGLASTVIADAHTTADRPHASAEQLIKHFNWNWPQLIAPNPPLVMSCAEAVALL